MAHSHFRLVSNAGAAARVLVAAGEPEYVFRAARDLVSDVERITGVRPALVRGDAPAPGDVFVATSPRGAWEACDVAVDAGGVLRIAGSDPRGTMFGVYAFLDEILGVDPLAFWNDAPYPRAESLVLDATALHAGSPAFRFRGWFLNDEDLLTGWHDGGGRRDIDYPFYGTVIAEDVAERVAEALVRCRMNLAIPASFVNLLNPPEARLAEIFAARGVFLTQHHVEPLGTSAFTFQAYWKARGRDVPFSWTSHPREVEEVWRATARAWARFPNVIWQLGLRGVADRPMWSADATAPVSDADRAAVISAAMERQMAILDEIGVPREGRIATVTLWGEGAVFYGRGLLRVPEGAIVIVSDNGPGWQWPGNCRPAARATAKPRGVYYHHAIFDAGPHLASLVPPARTAAMLEEARAAGAADYALLNVANVREFARGLDASARVLREGAAFDAAAWEKRWLARHFPDADCAAWGAAFAAYDAAPAIQPQTGWPLFLDGHIRKTAIRKVFQPFERGEVPDGDPSWDPFVGSKPPADLFYASIYPAFNPQPGTRAAAIAALDAQSAAFARAADAAAPLFARLPEECRAFAFAQLLHPALFMRDFSAWLAALLRWQENRALQCAALCPVPGAAAPGVCAVCPVPGAEAPGATALSLIDAILAREPEYCAGKWENWWRGCRKIDLRDLRRRTQTLSQSMAIDCNRQLSKGKS